MTNSVEDEMLAAIETLPPGLRERAAELPFPQLHNACLNCDLQLVAALVNAGLAADMYPCTDDEDDQPPLVWLAEHYDGDIKPAKQTIDLLIKLGADVDEGCPLLVAAERNHAKLVGAFIAAGADTAAALDDEPSSRAEALIMKLKPGAAVPKKKSV
jgi:hypothetical protein